MNQTAHVEKLNILSSKEIGDRVIAFVLRGIVSKVECQSYIEMAEMHQSGLRPCGYNPKIRKTNRLELKSNEISNILMKRVFPYLPRSIAVQKSTNG